MGGRRGSKWNTAQELWMIDVRKNWKKTDAIFLRIKDLYFWYLQYILKYILHVFTTLPTLATEGFLS